ncbi:MAG: TonB-dependent receptor, partial [Saprospiraceae bacterium]|nr:TonB-dependent receptor [Saprospiraceae bacterium]
YSGWILKQVKDPEIRNSSANFFDVNTNLTYRINNSNRLNYSYYRSGDKFNLLSNNEFNWENELQSLKWNGNLTKKLFSSITLSQSKYDYGAVEKNFLETFDYQSSLVDQNANLDLNYLLKDNNTISLGIGLKKIQISPGKLLNINQDEQILPVELEKEQGQEMAMYIQDELALGEKIGLSYGVRMNIFRYLGPKTVFNYTPFQPRTETYIESQTTFGKNDLIKSYHGFEPRFSLRYTLDEHSSLKAGYNRLIQNIALISNTVSIAPTDVWKLADTHLQPSTSDQYSLGYFRNFLDNTYEFSIEAYFKQINNLIDYKDGANLLLNQTIETELLSGEGLAYGIEVLLKKQIGTLSGWMSYTYSRSLRRVIGIFEDETINDGDWFPSFFDKPHDLTAVLQYRVSPRFKISSVFTYSTGRPISYPVAKFFYQNQDVAFYESRNGFRVPDYQRLDFSMTWSFKTEKKILAGDWILSIYNLTARRNAFSVFFDQEPFSPPQAYKLATLGIAFPSLNYKISL